MSLVYLQTSFKTQLSWMFLWVLRKTELKYQSEFVYAEKIQFI